MPATGSWTKVVDEDDYIQKGKTFTKVYTFKMNASYATGGDGVTPATDIGLDSADSILACEIHEAAGARTVDLRYDTANDKVLAYNAGTNTQTTSATDLSAPVHTAVFTCLKG